ncbi:MAG: hypothetical protein HXO02_03180 [Prevotella salivae]|nr:hypothetical protein [Segatella salivae]
MTGFHKFHATGTMLSINFCSHFMGSRHTKVSTKPPSTGGIIKPTATAMQASELPRKIICCQQRIVSAAATQASYLPRKNIYCQQRFVSAAATQASEPLKELKTCDLNKTSTTTKTLRCEII